MQSSAPIPDGFEESFVKIDGARLRFLHGGQGPPLILLHGLLGYSFSWRKNLEALGRVRTVYAPDQLGAGFSDRPSDLDCTMPAVAGRVLQFARQVGLNCFDLLATSHGGAVGITLAGMAEGRERIQRLILVAPANPWSRHGRVLVPLLNQHPISAAFLWTAPRLRVAHPYALRRLFGDRKRISPGTLEGYAAPLLQPGGFEYGIRILRSWREDMQRIQAVLPELRHTPVLLIWGSSDAAVNPQSAKVLRDLLPQSRLVLFPGVGHLPYEEVPEDFNRTVVSFLTEGE